MKALLELQKQKQKEIDFLKEHSYEQINDMFIELKTKLDTSESEVKKLNAYIVSKHSICGCGNPKVEHICQNCKGEIKHS